MALTYLQKEKIIKDFKIAPNDTGSSYIQIALLTKIINELADHLKLHKGDFHSKRGLIQNINKRKRLLKYIKKNNWSSYTQLTQRLGLRK